MSAPSPQKTEVGSNLSSVGYKLESDRNQLTKDLSSYTYKPLERRNIRILELQPGGDSDPFTGKFIIAPIDGKLEYDALSYMWGDATPVDSIIVEGAIVNIAANLSTALTHLRNHNSPEPLKIWVDAICINQNDLIERGQQVSMMRLVYQNAACVRVWINETIDESSPAVAALQNFQIPLESGRHELGSDNMGLGFDASFWEPVVPIFLNEYWLRIWIQQEVLNARRFQLHCRNVDFPGSSIACFYEAIKRLYNKAPPGSGDEMVDGFSSSIGFTPAPALFELFDSHFAKGPGWELIGLLSLCEDLQTRNGLDRIYAIMHLAKDYEEGDIVVDYTKTEVQVMMEAIVHHIARHRTLHFLESCVLMDTGNTSTDETLDRSSIPSWIPWAWFGDSALPGREIVGRNKTLKHKCSSKPVNMKEMQLGIRGIMVDTVKEYLPVGNFDNSTVSQFWSSQFGVYLQAASSTDWTELPGDLCRTLAFHRSELMDDDEVVSTLFSFYQLSQNEEFAERRIGYQGRDLLDELGHLSNSPLAGLAYLLLEMDERAVFLTEEGKHGLAPACDMKKGDEVWVILGCVSPVVLRRQPNGTYLHICTAHVPSLRGHEDAQYLKTGSMIGDKVGKWKIEDILLE